MGKKITGEDKLINDLKDLFRKRNEKKPPQL